METSKREPKYISDVMKCYDGLIAGTKTATIAEDVGVNPAFVTYVSVIAKDLREHGYDMASAKLPADAIKRQRILKMLASGMTRKQIAEQIPDTNLNYIRLVHNIYDVVRKVCVPPAGQSEDDPAPDSVEHSHTKGNLNYFISSNKGNATEATEPHQSTQTKEPRLISTVKSLSLNDILEDEERQIEQAKKLNKAKRRALLQNSNPKPKKVIISQTVLIRNPYVVVEVLERANGICERCGNPAPFLRDSDNSPFLEVHHMTPLAEGGDDTVDNAIGLCPNCHRHAHYGKESFKL